jgi:predicted DNA-binding protein (MmcQ/YjbR family)
LTTLRVIAGGMPAIQPIMNIEQLRKFCLSFPGATEDIKWGADLCFSVGGKMFTVTSADATDSGVSLKTTPERFAELTERPGIIPAHYVARYHWITIEDLKAVTAAELKDLIRASYKMVFDKLPSKIKKTIESQ